MVNNYERKHKKPSKLPQRRMSELSEWMIELREAMRFWNF